MQAGALDSTSALVDEWAGAGLEANRCGGGRKSSSKTGEPGESLSTSLTVMGCRGRLPPNASLNVHQVARISGGTCVRRLGTSGVAATFALVVETV